MIIKTDKFLKRRARVWERGWANSDKVTEIYLRETWWLLWVIPLYSRETVVEKPRW